MKEIAVAFALAMTSCVSDQQVCANFGYTPGTEAFANCMQNRYAQRQQAMQSSAAQQQAQQQSWYHEEMENIRAAQRANAANRPTNTNCYWMGNVMRCSSY